MADLKATVSALRLVSPADYEAHAWNRAIDAVLALLPSAPPTCATRCSCCTPECLVDGYRCGEAPAEPTPAQKPRTA